MSSLTHDAGMQVSEVVVQQDYVSTSDSTRADRISFTSECIEAAAAAGVGNINLFTGPEPWNPSAAVLGRDVLEETAWQMVFDAFDTLTPVAESSGVDLAVEPVLCMLVHDLPSVTPLLERYDSSRLSVNLDPSHLALYRNDIPQAIRSLGPRIRHVHLKDAVGEPSFTREGEFLFPLLGEGLVNWSEFFAALDDVGYSGFMSVEFESFKYLDTVLGGNIEEAARVSYDAVLTLAGC